MTVFEEEKRVGIRGNASACNGFSPRGMGVFAVWNRDGYH